MLHVFVSPERAIVPWAVNIVNIVLNCQYCLPYCQYCSQLLSMRAIVNYYQCVPLSIILNACHCPLDGQYCLQTATFGID